LKELCLEGKLNNRSYEDKEGKKQYVTEIIMHEMKMLRAPKAQAETIYEPTLLKPVCVCVCVCVCVIKAQKEVRMGNYFIRHGSRKPSSILRNSLEYNNLVRKKDGIIQYQSLVRARGFATITS